MSFTERMDSVGRITAEKRIFPKNLRNKSIYNRVATLSQSGLSFILNIQLRSKGRIVCATRDSLIHLIILQNTVSLKATEIGKSCIVSFETTLYTLFPFSFWKKVGRSLRVKGADCALERIHNIREALPELWEEAEKSEDIRYSGKVTFETPVTA